MHVSLCSVRFKFFSTMLSDWLGRMSVQWHFVSNGIMGSRTLTQSIETVACVLMLVLLFAIGGVAWSICVCLLVTFVSHAKTAEPVEMPFGWITRWAQGTMYYMGIQISKGKGQFLALSSPLKNIVSHFCGVRGKNNQ